MVSVFLGGYFIFSLCNHFARDVLCFLFFNVPFRKCNHVFSFDNELLLLILLLRFNSDSVVAIFSSEIIISSWESNDWVNREERK